MAFSNGYRGVNHGSVQTTYQDQPGIGGNGMLAYGTDLLNVDAYVIGETDGIRAGAGIRLLSVNDGLNFQRPGRAAYLPEGDETAAEFGGIVVFDEAMNSDENGISGWKQGRYARILRPSRAGGRIYVLVKDAIVAGTSTVNWVIAADAAAKYEVGDFCPTALAGGTAGTSVALNHLQWETSCSAGECAILELHGTVIPTLSTDASDAS